MKTKQNMIKLLFSLVLVNLFYSCENKNKDIVQNKLSTILPEQINIEKKEITPEFKNYWHSGTAEITSYELKQARYGEIREGNAVLIYVTEPFLSDKQVKADHHNPDNVSVLKLNTTKNYITGIYPYSIMTSSFYPVKDNQHALKVSFSAQEWCGHVYGQLNNKKNFEVTSHSYFESEGDQKFNLPKELLENEIWNKIRVNPKNLPIGEFNMIPSLEYMRLSHIEFKSYAASATLESNENINIYSITYPKLDRTLRIEFSKKFPYTIEGWTENFEDGYGKDKKRLISTAKKIHSIKSPYWTKKSNADLSLRDSLGL